jgi:hypothetical protein
MSPEVAFGFGDALRKLMKRPLNLPGRQKGGKTAR